MSRIVFAFTIGKVEEKGWDYRIVPADSEKFTAVLVDARWVKDHAPQPGGTLTRYDTGDMAYTPPRETAPSSEPDDAADPPGPPGLGRESVVLDAEDVREPVLAGHTVDGTTELFVPAGEPIPGEEDQREP